jgi:hypothetical protein
VDWTAESGEGGGVDGAGSNCLKSLKVLISSCPTSCSASLLSNTGEWISPSEGSQLAAHEGVEVPHSASDLWPIRKVSNSIGSIALSLEAGGGLHMKGRMSSTKLMASNSMSGGAGAPFKKQLWRVLRGCVELHST